MYKKARTQRAFYSKSEKEKQKKGRAHLSASKVNRLGSTKGYNLIMSLHKMFMDRTFKTD